MWVFVLLGPAPFLVVLLDLRRNANLAGGFAGRRVFGVSFCFCVLDMPTFLILANRAEAEISTRESYASLSEQARARAPPSRLG